MAVLGAKMFFGLASAGASIALNVGFFVCFTMPKETLKIYINIQKEIFLLPFRCASVNYKVVRKLLTPKQPTKHIADVSDGYKSEEIALRSPAEESLPVSDPSVARNDNKSPAEESIPGFDPSAPRNDNNISEESLLAEESVLERKEEGSSDSSVSSDDDSTDIESLPANIDGESPETERDDETILTKEYTDAELEQIMATIQAELMTDWRYKLVYRYIESDKGCDLKNSDKERLQFSHLTRELYHSLHTMWKLWGRFKSRREEMGVEFRKMTRSLFNTSVPKVKGIDLEYMKEISDHKDFLKTISTTDHVKAKLKTIKKEVQMFCPKTSSGKRVLGDFEALQAVIEEIALKNQFRRSDLNNALKYDVFFYDWKVEVLYLANQFHKMLSIEEKLKDLQHQLDDARELLLRAECDRDDMVWKLDTLVKMIQEEEDFFAIGYKYEDELKISSCHEMQTD